MKLTFKEYLETKQKLVEAVKRSPIQRSTYTLTKYCKLAVFEDETKVTLLLKPKQQINVEWRYDDINNPTPFSICVEDAKDLSSDTYHTTWKGSKLKQWLSKNTFENINN